MRSGWVRLSWQPEVVQEEEGCCICMRNGAKSEDNLLGKHGCVVGRLSLRVNVYCNKSVRLRAIHCTSYMFLFIVKYG